MFVFYVTYVLNVVGSQGGGPTVHCMQRPEQPSVDLNPNPNPRTKRRQPHWQSTAAVQELRNQSVRRAG